jgi:hypothetical protein
MNVKKIQVNNPKLQEGQYLDFEVVKSLEIDRDQKFWVLRDPLGYKVLLPYELYKDYGIQKGETINCRIDRVNCNGKVFLEPRHPYYREGEVYNFPLVDVETSSSLLGDNVFFYIVKDVHNNHLKVNASLLSDQPAPQIVQCFVERVKKGRLLLKLQRQEEKSLRESFRSWRLFQVTGESYDPEEKQKYFIAADSLDQKYLISKKHFSSYEITLGKQVKCKISQLSVHGVYLLEPEHPIYKEGEQYKFEISHLEQMEFSDNNVQDFLVVNDCFDEKVKIEITSGELSGLKDKTHVYARVNSIEKSRPDLSLVSF